jgi:hypothetical protein
MVEMAARNEVFSGWKEIASYLGKGVRSVQRYERELGLPIHRPARKTRGAVIATKAELDDWVLAGPVRADLIPRYRLAERTNRVGAQFLRVDSEIALTFSALAREARDQEKRELRTRTARKAYDTIMQLRKRIHLSDVDTDKLDTNLQRLRGELQSLGESL